MNSAIIVAAGTGSRFGGNIPKQFVEICGKPLLAHTLEKFETCGAIDEIVLVVSDDVVSSLDKFLDTAQFTKLKSVVAGGSSRAESVRNGLGAVNAQCRVAAVHDGARPLVAVDEIAEVVAKANETGAACLVASVTDTIKTIRGDEISGTLDRTNLRRALTPQAFKLEVLRNAFELSGLDEAVTDECYMVEKLGHPIAFVEGNARNLKVTRRDDIAFVRAIIESRE